MGTTLRLPEFARDSHLTTEITPDGTIHYYDDTPTRTTKELWKRDKKLGFGRSSTVWLETCIMGHEPGSSSLRAVKVIPVHEGAQGVIKYGRELEALAKFSQRKYSRCFVKSFGWFHTSSSISICMEYLPLGDLRAYLVKQNEPRVPEADAQKIVSQVLDGLRFMHDEGFAHRDLKPANMLIKSHAPEPWWVKLSDLGLSKRMEMTEGFSGAQGTPGFIAPELQFHSANDKINAYAADIWSLGETAFQLLTGKATFSDTALEKYWRGECEFPVSLLRQYDASSEMVGFITSAMLADHERRPDVHAASGHRWLQELQTRPSEIFGHLPLAFSHVLPSREVGDSSDMGSDGPVTVSRNWSAISNLRATQLQDPLPDDTISSYGKNREIMELVLKAQRSESKDSSTPMPTEMLDNNSVPVQESGSRAESPEPLARSASYASSSNSSTRMLERSLSAESITEAVDTKTLNLAALDEFWEGSENTMGQAFQMAVLKGKHENATSMTVASDSKSILTHSADGTTGVWNIEAKALVNFHRGAAVRLESAPISPDSKLVACVSADNVLQILDAAERRVNKTLGNPSSDASYTSLCLVQDGKGVAASTSDGTIEIWNVIKGRIVQKLKGHGNAVIWLGCYGGIISNQLTSVSSDGQVRTWRQDSYTMLSLRGWIMGSVKKGSETGQSHFLADGITAVAVSLSETRLAAIGLDGDIHLWQCRFMFGKLELITETRLKGHVNPVLSVVFSVDSLLLASASAESVWLWKGNSGQSILTIRGVETGPARSVTFSPDAQFLATTLADGRVGYLDVIKAQELSDVQDHLEKAAFAAVSPDGRYIASVYRQHNPRDENWYTQKKAEESKSAGPPTIMLWDAESEKPLSLISGHKSEIIALSFSDDARCLGSISSDHSARIWDISTGECINSVVSAISYNDRCPVAAFSRDMSYFATVFQRKLDNSDRDFAINLCDLESRSAQATADRTTYHAHPRKVFTRHVADKADIRTIAFSPDVRKIAAVDLDTTATIWDVVTRHILARIVDPCREWLWDSLVFLSTTESEASMRHLYHCSMQGAPMLRFSGDSKQLSFSTGLLEIRFWDVENGRLLRRIGSNNAKARGRSGLGGFDPWCNISATVSADWSRCLAPFQPGRLGLWDVSDGRLVAKLEQGGKILCVAFSLVSGLLATASDKDLVIRDAETGGGRTRIATKVCWPLRSVTFWPDPWHLMSISESGVLQLWDVDSGSLVKEFDGHTGRHSINWR